MKEKLIKTSFAVLLFFFVSLALTSCQSDSAVTQSNEPVISGTIQIELDDPTITTAPKTSSPQSGSVYSPHLGAYEFQKSDPNTATLHGILFVTDINLAQPDPNDPIFLVPLSEDSVKTIPTFAVGEVPQAEVDERTGEFVFTNVNPGLYVVVVLLKTGVQLPSFRMDDGRLATIRVTEDDLDKTIELEYLRIP